MGTSTSKSIIIMKKKPKEIYHRDPSGNILIFKPYSLQKFIHKDLSKR